MRFFGYVLGEWLDERPNEVDDDSSMREFKTLTVACDKYLRHIDSLPALPQQLKAIAHPFYVDDALFVRAVYEPVKARLELILRCGNNPDGYFDLILRYEDVEIDPEDLVELARAARGAITDRRYLHDAYCYEFDLLPDGRIEHGFLFHGTWKRIATEQFERVLPVMFSVRCRSLSYERVERPDRKLPRIKDRFRIVTV